MKIKLFDINLDSLKREEAIQSFVSLLDLKSPSLVATVNMEFIAIAQHDNEFKKVLNSSSKLNFVDGAGIILNYGLMNAWKPKTLIIKQLYVVLQWIIVYAFFPISVSCYRKYIPTTISGSDFVWDIAKLSAKNNYRIFLLGYSLGLDPSAVEKASLKLQTDIHGLKVVGVFSGTDSISEEEKITGIIKKSGADILLIGLGSPRQEKWLDKNLSKTGCKIGIGIGGTFDFIAGAQKRAPRWIRRIGMEWLFRLIQNPKRIKRQLALPKIAFMVLKSRLS